MVTSYDTESIDRCLPQTQCTQCDYPRCWDYAEAIARGEAALNQCPPGGDITIQALAHVLVKSEKPLNPENGAHKPRTLAVIREAECIGCTKCIQVCPVDAIVGGAKQMHTIISSLCTGCELCLPPCPLDCIDLVSYQTQPSLHYPTWPDYAEEEVNLARQQINKRLLRLQQRHTVPKTNKQSHSRLTNKTRDEIRNEIAEAILRVKNKKTNPDS